MKIKLFLFALYLCPFCVISLYNHPAIDDFWSANVIREHGRLGAVSYFYQTVSARYFSNFLMSLFNTLPEGSIWIFKAWPLVIILMLIASLNFFYRSLFEGYITTARLLLMSLFFVTVYIANMRTLFEGLYWMSATICYQLAICLFTVSIGSIARYLKNPSFKYGVLAVACCILLPGTAESIVPIFLLVLFAIIYIVIKQRLSLWLIIFCLLVTVCGLAVILASNGNHARVAKDALGYHQNVLLAMFYAARSMGYYIAVWGIIPINLVSLMLLLPALEKFRSISIPASLSTNGFLISGVAGFTICMSPYLPQHYFESSIPFPRVTTMVFFISCHLMVLAIWLLLKRNLKFGLLVSSFFSRKNYRSYAWGIFFLAAFLSKNFLSVVSDLFSGNAYQYSLEATNRYQLIKNTIGDTSYVPMYNHWPAFIRSSSRQTNNSDAFIHMDEYFGKTILYIPARTNTK